MTQPPRFAEWLLAASAARTEGDAIVGDLCEEFRGYIVPQRGAFLARWWYRVQVARSIASLCFRSWERASVARASAAVSGAAVAAILPAASLLMLRTFVLQQVPLKTTAEVSMWFSAMFAAVSVTGIGLGIAFAVQLLRSDRRP